MSDITTTDVQKSQPPVIPPRTQPEPVSSVPPILEAKKETPKEVEPPKDDLKSYPQEEVDRIVEKVRKNAEYRTRRELKAYYEGRESVAKPEAPKAEAPKAEDKMPVRDDFPDWDTFSEEKSAWVARKAVREENEKIAKERKDREAAQARDQRMDDFRKKTRERFADIEQRIEAIADVELSADVADVIAESEFGPDILNHFIEKRDDLERISKLSPQAAAREIGRLEARFESAAKKPETTAEPPKQSAAPPPITPVSGGKTAAATAGPSDKDDIKTWMQKRNAEVAAKRGLTA